MKSQKGFINSVMLLFLIISGASVAISFVNIKKNIVNSQDSALINDAKVYLKAATVWKSTKELLGSTNNCVTFDTLNHTYVDDEDVYYDGYIEFIEGIPIIYI